MRTRASWLNTCLTTLVVVLLVARPAAAQSTIDATTAMNQAIAAYVTAFKQQDRGDVAYETGRSTFTFLTAKGETRTLAGQFMTVWRRQPDGQWKVQVEAWL